MNFEIYIDSLGASKVDLDMTVRTVEAKPVKTRIPAITMKVVDVSPEMVYKNYINIS